MSINDSEIIALFEEFYLIPETVPESHFKENQKNGKSLIVEGHIGAPYLFVYHNKTELSDQDHTMLGNLKHVAMKLLPDDVCTVYMKDNPDFVEDEILQILKPHYVISWLSKDGGHQLEHIGGIKVLRVLLPNKYQNDKSLKIDLWQHIQKFTK
jgi:hypothetical protein